MYRCKSGQRKEINMTMLNGNEMRGKLEAHLRRVRLETETKMEIAPVESTHLATSNAQPQEG